MSFFRAVARLAGVAVPRNRLLHIPVKQLRFNSSIQQNSSPASLTAQILGHEKDKITEEDLDEWLSAIRTLKQGEKQPETETEIYLDEFLKPEQFLNEKFEPTVAQLAEVERFKAAPVPLKEDPTVEHFVNVIMRHGKKTRARTIVSRAFYLVSLRTGQDPVRVFYEALERLGPLFDTRTEKTGFAKNRIVPIALDKRQRNRYAMNWILEGSNNKKSPALSVRLAEEIINAFEGRSSGYDKKARMHKEAITQRSYLRK